MRIKLLAMDVDGTLTDGHIYIGAEGEIMKAFDVKDGYGIAHILPRYGIIPVIITGRRSQIIEQRCSELGITELYQGIGDKLGKLREIAAKYSLHPEEVAYIGDDENDLACMRYAGLSACPSDADEAAIDTVDYVCKASGGRSAVREFIKYIINNIDNQCKGM